MPNMGLLSQDSDSANGSGGPETANLQVSSVAEGNAATDNGRYNRWHDALGNTQLRKRILHDVASCDDEIGARRVFEKLSKRICENARGSRVVAIAAHLQGNRSHIHIVHDCNWNSTSCKDVFLQDIRIVKRKAKYNRWSSELDWEFWQNLFDYLYRRGGR